MRWVESNDLEGPLKRISRLSVKLKPAVSLGAVQPQAETLGPFLQGFLLEHVDPSYASLVHQLPFNPYSQYCTAGKDGCLIWTVNALTNEAADNLIEPIRSIETVCLHAANAQYEVVSTSVETVDLKCLLDSIYEDGSTKVRVQFVTPTAFKSQGRYVIMPSVRLMFQNLLMHYGQVYSAEKEIDSDTVDFIDQNVLISSYNLQSRYYSNTAPHGKKIPAFAGGATLSLSGPASMMGLVRMLLKFGEYSGLGIKTSMGMGGMVCKWGSQNGEMRR